MRKTKKTLALLLTLAMVLTLFAGVAQASTNVSIVGAVATVLPNQTIALGRIDIRGDDRPAVAANDQTVVRVTLPSGFTWVDPNVDTNETVIPTSTITRADDNRTATFTITAAADVSLIRFENLDVVVPAGFSGDVLAEVLVTGETSVGDFVWSQSQSVRIAVVSARGTTSRAVTTPNVVRGRAGQNVGNIEIRENIAGTFPTATTSIITLTLPSGVVFTAENTLGFSISGTTSSIAGNVATITLPAGLSGRQTLTVSNIFINVDNTVVDGPINVQIANGSPTANVTDAIVSVATVGVVGVVSASRQGDLPSVWNLGRVDRAIGTIRLTENVAGALGRNSVVTLTLPVGYSWFTAPSNTTVFGSGTPSVSEGGRTLTYWTQPTITGGPNFDLTGGRINANAATAVPGDVVVTVGGSAGATGTVTVATSRRPVTVTAATTPNVRVNSLNQTVGSIVISEVAQGIFRTGSLTITLPAGVTIAAAGSASVSVASGTAPTTGTISSSVNVITIPVTSAFAPTQPATITISGIRLNTDGVAMRPIVVDVAGSSILDTVSAGVSTVTIDNAVGANFGDDLLVANVITATAKRTVFTVDATAYTVDGAAQPALDVAPVIQDGRTMMPIRAAATAAGVTAENILFEAGVITIIRGDRIAQFNLGSRVMVVNGVAMNMDVAPALVAGRALIPVRWVGTALGVPVVWDGTARTVTVTVQ